jgi:hypothetical protein
VRTLADTAVPLPFLVARPKSVIHRGDCGPRLARAGVAATRIPGRSAGDPMNSMPAASKAPLTLSNVDERLGGTSSTASKRLIVLAVTPAFFANCSVVQRRALLADRIWRPVIIDSRPIVTYGDNKIPSGDYCDPIGPIYSSAALTQAKEVTRGPGLFCS